MANIVTRFTERFGCRHPFACAGMAFAGMTPELALAVCRGGGVGAIGVGLTPAEQLRATIQEMRKQTTAPFNINFITFFDNEAQIRVCAEEHVPIVSFHWGHPSTEHIKLLRDAGVSIWEQIGSVDAARTALGDGIEVVVAQGWEAGGHNYGGLPTLALVPTVVDAVAPSLVLAAGGIADGRGAAAARSVPMACGSGRGWWRPENQPYTPSTNAASSPPAGSRRFSPPSSVPNGRTSIRCASYEIAWSKNGTTA